MPMKRLKIALALTFVLAGSATASPAMTTYPTAMRAAPNSHSHIVQSIPANAQIDVGGCGRVWCSASWREISGFVRTSAVSTAGGAPLVYAPPPPPVYGGPVIAPFGGYGWGPYGHHGYFGY